MKKIILGITSLFVMMAFSGCATTHMGWTAVTQQYKLDDGAMEAYDDLFSEVAKNGDPAKAMMKEYKVSDEISADEVKASIYSLTEEYNMRITNYVKMFTKEDAKPNEVKEARIYSLCSLYIAKKFLNYSRYFGGFMPCRIMYLKYGNGDAYLITMDLTLAIHGGFPLPDDMLTLATDVNKAMIEIPQRAAKGDF